MYCMVDCIAEVVNLICIDIGNERAKPEEQQSVCKRHISTHRGYGGPMDFYFETSAPYDTLVLGMVVYNATDKGVRPEDLKRLATFNLNENTSSAIAFAAEAIMKYK